MKKDTKYLNFDNYTEIMGIATKSKKKKCVQINNKKNKTT